MEEECISIEDDDLTTRQQSPGDDSVFIDVPDSSVDNIPAHEYSDDNIDDIGGGGGEEEEEEEKEDDNPLGPLHDNSAAGTASAADPTEAEDPHRQSHTGDQLQAYPEAAAAAAAALEGGDERKTDPEDRPTIPEVVATPKEEEEEGARAEEGFEEDPSPVTSTPKANGGKSPGKTLKQKLGQIVTDNAARARLLGVGANPIGLAAVPARLSKLSIFNALRSGTYLVNEPPPPPPSATKDDETANDDDKINAETNPADNNDETVDADNKTEGGASLLNSKDDDNHKGQSEEKAGASPKKKARTMTDNGVVASEDSPQVAMTKMPEETLPPEEQGEEDLPVIPQQSMMAMRKPHSVHR
ncbi:hypothetical protein ACOMHN_023989 [Nucella lapillus]